MAYKRREPQIPMWGPYALCPSTPEDNQPVPQIFVFGQGENGQAAVVEKWPLDEVFRNFLEHV
jgi:hypothetical protein